jgi:hypothetical protein
VSAWEPLASATTSCTIGDSRRRVCPVGVVSRGKAQPWIICLSPLLELQCLTPLTTQQSVSSVRGVLWESSVLDHLPESIAGAAVFDPMPCVGSAVGSNEDQLRCHPMVHEGRCKHPALHLRHHLQVRLNPSSDGP